MNRKQFFGNLLGLAGIAASAKELSKLSISKPTPTIETIEYSGYTFNFVGLDALDSDAGWFYTEEHKEKGRKLMGEINRQFLLGEPLNEEL